MNLTLFKTVFVVLSLSQSVAQSALPQTYPPEPDWQQAFMLRPGESRKLNSATLTFDEVAQDSRCPQNVECYWPGEATLRLTLTPDEETGLKEFDFSLKSGGFGILYKASAITLKNVHVAVLWLSQEGEYRAVLMTAAESN